VLDLTGTVVGVNARRGFVTVRLPGYDICLMRWLEGELPAPGDILRGPFFGTPGLRNVTSGWEVQASVEATHCTAGAAARLLGG
jgi:hypothetical protein